MEDKQEDFDYDRYFRSYREIDNYIENYIAMSSINTKNIKEEEILFVKDTNREQVDIAKQIEINDAVVVQGPPGTGKTHTIANLLGHFLAQGKNVLITSHTKKALRVLKEKIPKNIQGLCISILDDDNSDMRKSVESISEKMGHFTSDNLKKEVEELFYSESNMKYLEKIITDIESGKAKLVEHDLIEE